MAPQTRSMKIRRAEEVESHVLPQELIEEILARLPVKSLLKFRCVCKPWRSLFSSNRLIKLHYENSINNQTFGHEKVIHQILCSKYTASILPVGTNLSVDLSPIDDPINDHPLMTGSLVGFSYGLLCFFKEGCFHLWNPATRFSVKLPRIRIYNIEKYGFGWDEGSGAFKVVVVVSRSSRGQDRVVGKVYSSETNSWKTLDYDMGYLDLESSTEVGHLQLEYFDFETQEFFEKKHECPPFTVIDVGDINAVAMISSKGGCRDIIGQLYVESLVSPQGHASIGRPKRQRRGPDRYA